MNRQELQAKLSVVTSELLREKGYISTVDVLMKLGCLDRKDYEAWRTRKVPYLERVIKINLSRLDFIIRAVQRNSRNGRLRPRWTAYVSWGKGHKVPLRFSKSGEPAIERGYATHFLKGEAPHGQAGQ